MIGLTVALAGYSIVFAALCAGRPDDSEVRGKLYGLGVMFGLAVMFAGCMFGIGEDN